MNTDEIWTSKYAPKTTQQMVGSRYPIETALKWLKGWKTQQKRSLLISGPVGCGKSLLARLICKESGFTDVVEINASKARTKKAIQELEEMFKTNTIMSYFCKLSNGGRPGCMIADEVDACDQGGLSQLVSFIKSGMIPVICTCGEGYKKQLLALQTISQQVRISKPTTEQICPLLCSIAYDQKFSHNFTQQRSKGLAAACNCDVRQSVTELQFLSHSLKAVSVLKAPLALGTTSDGVICDKELGVFDTLSRLFPMRDSERIPNPEECDRLHSTDRSLISALIEENYPSIKKLNLEDLASMADSISLGDVFERKLPGELQSIHAVTWPVFLAKGKGGISQSKFPNCFGNLSKVTSKKKEAKNVTRLYNKFSADSCELIPYLYLCLAGPALKYHNVPKVKVAIAAKLKGIHLGSKVSWETICYMGSIKELPTSEKTKLNAVGSLLICDKPSSSKKRKREEEEGSGGGDDCSGEEGEEETKKRRL
jgi:DNA polymerase III delta prime subunit